MITPLVEIVCDNIPMCLKAESVRLTEINRDAYTHALAKFADWGWIIDGYLDFCSVDCQEEYQRRMAND